MKKYSKILRLAFILFFFGCIDEIDLNVNTEQRTLVVDGFVSDVEKDFVLKLSLSSVIGVGRDNLLDPVVDAMVMLEDDQGNTYPYLEQEDGKYILSGFGAKIGIKYNIDITLNDGSHFKSKPAQLRSSSEISSVSYKVEEETFRNNIGELVTTNQLSMQIGTDVSQSAEPPFLRWRVEGQYQLSENYRGAITTKICFVTNNVDINEIRVFDTSKLDGGLLFDQEIANTEYDFRFAEQFCFHISQFSISEEEYDYWNNIQDIINISGSLFDPPPGTLVGNIFNVDDPEIVAVGYFSVASESFRREFVNRVKTGVFVDTRCVIRFGRETPFGCRECLDLINSTSVKPDYWVF